MNEIKRVGAMIGSGGYAQDATSPRDKTSTEVILDRLRATAEMLGHHTSQIGISVDRLSGGMPVADQAIKQTPMPTDFIGSATALLDGIGGHLDRLQGHAGRLSRIA